MAGFGGLRSLQSFSTRPLLVTYEVTISPLIMRPLEGVVLRWARNPDPWDTESRALQYWTRYSLLRGSNNSKVLLWGHRCTMMGTSRAWRRCGHGNLTPAPCHDTGRTIKTAMPLCSAMNAQTQGDHVITVAEVRLVADGRANSVLQLQHKSR
ncbi:hypothetical protein HC256_003983 [Beauveria bassiana]|nr:hypothetical protein HC256_003983 [Beauveria bassiana]KAH8715131.1 hypothetical protein HC256_003983 [Beauveria bassiana]